MPDPFHNLMVEALGKRKPHDPKPAGLMGFFNVADSKKEYNRDKLFDGYRRGDSVIYVRCVFHRERTPSLAIYIGTNGSVRKNRPRFLGYKCYGCGASGSLESLTKRLKNTPLPPETRFDFENVERQRILKLREEMLNEPLPF